eukprot:scaffold73953_cov32-Tisochrysis_lutea.AAC.8
MILFATATNLYMGRGAIIMSFLGCYSATAIVAGYTSGALYAGSSGTAWIRTMAYTASLFPASCASVMLVLNVVSTLYGEVLCLTFFALHGVASTGRWSLSSQNPPPHAAGSLGTVGFSSSFAVVLIWLLAVCPMTVIGTLLGRHWSGTPSYPCRVNAIPRVIPDKRWYARPAMLVALGGVLPFGSIFIEMYFVFTSFWNYKFYYVYGFMLLVFLILTVVTVCVTIVVTYFLLNNEDYRWPWTSFLSSASTALYVFAYSVFYFLIKTRMSGFFQTVRRRASPSSQSHGPQTFLYACLECPALPLLSRSLIPPWQHRCFTSAT